MNFPDQVKLTNAEVKALIDLQIKVDAINRTIQMIVSEGERRHAQYIEANKKIWSELALKYGIDIKNVVWDLDNQSGVIKPRQITLSTPSRE